jgi:hypothetical protein
MKPFLPDDFGIYKGFLTTKNQTEIYCEAKFVLVVSSTPRHERDSHG